MSLFPFFLFTHKLLCFYRVLFLTSCDPPPLRTSYCFCCLLLPSCLQAASFLGSVLVFLVFVLVFVLLLLLISPFCKALVFLLLPVFCLLVWVENLSLLWRASHVFLWNTTASPWKERLLLHTPASPYGFRLLLPKQLAVGFATASQRSWLSLSLSLSFFSTTLFHGLWLEATRSRITNVCGC